MTTIDTYKLIKLIISQNSSKLQSLYLIIPQVSSNCYAYYSQSIQFGKYDWRDVCIQNIINLIAYINIYTIPAVAYTRQRKTCLSAADAYTS